MDGIALVSPFLVGGPAYSGTTLLALLLNQDNVVCLDEPDFGKPAQAHRGIPVLRSRVPSAPLPNAPTRALTREEAFEFARACAQAVEPRVLGVKTCDWEFVQTARLFRSAGLRVVAIVRDIRDALVRSLPPWFTEESLNESYRLVWRSLALFDDWIRYEDLVADTAGTMKRVADALRLDIAPRTRWKEDEVPAGMIKAERHELLRTGSVSSERVAIWRAADRTFSAESHETAAMMGYAP